jgi:hypothetical protein
MREPPCKALGVGEGQARQAVGGGGVTVQFRYTYHLAKRLALARWGLRAKRLALARVGEGRDSLPPIFFEKSILDRLLPGTIWCERNEPTRGSSRTC